MSNQHCAKGLDCGILGNHTHPDVVGVQRGIAVGEANVTPTPVPSEAAVTTAGEREVEALAKVAAAADSDAAEYDVARAVLASDWLAARDDRVRREEGERIAQAIEAASEPCVHSILTDGCFSCAIGHAARIARAASVGRGEGL